MALGRIKIKAGKKFHAQQHSDYIFGNGKYRHKDAKDDIKYKCVANLPKFADKDINFFWECADEFERKNGSTYREHELSLPRELTPKQQLELIHDWLKQQGIDKLVHQYAIHSPLASDGKPQPHCHLMFCERQLDGIERPAAQFFMRHNAKYPTKGGCKKLNTGMDQKQRKAQILKIRHDWGELINTHLAKHNHTQRVDMRNWWHRGLDQKPINLPMSFFKPITAEIAQSHQSLKSDIEAHRSLRPNSEVHTRLEVLKEQQRAASALKIENERLTKLAELETQKAKQREQVKQQKAQIQADFVAKHIRALAEEAVFLIDTMTDAQHQQFIADTISAFGTAGAVARSKPMETSPNPEKENQSSPIKEEMNEPVSKIADIPKSSPRFRP